MKCENEQKVGFPRQRGILRAAFCGFLALISISLYCSGLCLGICGCGRFNQWFLQLDPTASGCCFHGSDLLFCMRKVVCPWIHIDPVLVCGSVPKTDLVWINSMFYQEKSNVPPSLWDVWMLLGNVWRHHPNFREHHGHRD
jgi:hypothetical protein